MSLTTVGQISNETAAHVYRMMGELADRLIAAGQLSAAQRSSFFAAKVAERFTALGLQIPKKIVADAGISISKSATASSGAVTQAVSGAALGAAKATGAQVFKRTLASSAPGAAVVFAIQGAHTTYKYARGHIDGAEAGRRAAESAATNVGGMGGAAAGAAIGTLIFPGVGTLIGSIVGGAGGAIGSEKLTRAFTRSGGPLTQKKENV